MTDPFTFTLRAVPLSVLNRALDLHGVDRADTERAAWEALISAEGRKDGTGPYTPIAQAVAEYMSATGPWSEGGEYAGQCGYSVAIT